MSRWLKRLRNKLRNRKPALLLASVVLVLAVALGWSLSENKNGNAVQEDDAQVVSAVKKWQIIVVHHYLVGPSMEEQYEFSEAEYEAWIATNTNMKKVETRGDSVIYEHAVSDLSPVLKDRGRFALDTSGMLHLYEGETKLENIIQTFFQIDLERLETTLPVEEYMQLRQGIPIRSLADYNSILSAYGEYAIVEVEGHEAEQY